ncbi:hypothetical protein GGS23DRAFT_312515 [Durotheca rogersii]|uniref:uncharacterized protein n=1 Tax=Durotheca rogersii TaxID=419775 RepID=UPI00221F0CF1|nr:uncharacterized protein GGS23DRAFT_312515 [Durotheca rogersii]KAI5859542.1 hypothetical protein GGS23DRAFT_312515 [Durotheca rogersii]
MATTTKTSAPPPPAAPSQLAQQILDHRAPRYTFSFSPFLRATYGHGFPPNRPICKAFVAGHCPLGAAACPDRHVSAANGQPGGGGGGGYLGGGGGVNNTSYNSLVCKHWLRALCKKGDSCEFLHEYNLRKMPECNFFVRNGYCSNGDECLYLHIDPQSKLPPCPHYERGFCPLGPTCSKKHVRRKLCPCYLAGFCPDGRACREGAHPRWDTNLEKPVAKAELPPDDPQQPPGFGRRDDHGADDDARDFGGRRGDRDDRGGRGERFGGRGGRWRGRGDRKFGRGRGHH